MNWRDRLRMTSDDLDMEDAYDELLTRSEMALRDAKQAREKNQKVLERVRELKERKNVKPGTD